MEPENLGRLSAAFERPIVRRLGHLLERLGHRDRAGLMREGLFPGRLPAWAERDRGKADLGADPVERDRLWRVVVRRPTAIDE